MPARQDLPLDLMLGNGHGSGQVAGGIAMVNVRSQLCSVGHSQPHSLFVPSPVYVAPHLMAEAAIQAEVLPPQHDASNP